MTKSMIARLWVVGLALFALILFALNAWGATSSSTAIEAADRPIAADAATGETASQSNGVPAPESNEPPPAAADDSVEISATADNGEVDGDQAADAAPAESSAAAQAASQSDANSVAARQARGMAGQPTVAQDSDDGTVTMTLLHNNDGESKLLPNIDGGFPGIARFADAWVELGRSTDADILLRVSSGDNFLASKEFSAGLARDGQPLYDSIALRGLYEAMGLGNHDFDFGPEVTARFIDGFRLNENSDPVPFVAANVDVSGEPALQALVDEGRIAPSTVFTDPTSGLDVGVIGALTPRLANISSPRNVVVDPDVAGAVNAEAERLISDGVDRIVLVSHLQGLDEDRDLVPELSGIDIVVAGGGDELLKNEGDTCQPDEEAVAPYPLLLTDADGNDVPVVTAPGGYRCIGQLEVTFDDEGRITALSGSAVGVDLDGDAEEFAMARVEEPLAEALAELDAAIVGESDVVLDGRRSSVRTGATNVGELLADALLAAGQQAPDFGGPAAIVAVQNGGGIRNDSEIPAGEITEADTFDIAPFANFVVVGEVPREQFKELLEVAVAGLPNAEGTFPQIAGFNLRVDVSRSARQIDNDGDCSLIGEEGTRVRNARLDDGTWIVRNGEVVPGDDVALATIDFLAGGGDCYPLGDIDFTQVGSSYQQALSNFITDGLDGEISGEAYPVEGSRITLLNAEEASPSGTASADDEPASSDTDDDTEDTGDAAEDESSADSETSDDAETSDDSAADESSDAPDELPNTGIESWLVLVLALTIAAAGALVFFEAQRVGWLSLTNRLSATRPWKPSPDPEEHCF